MKKKLEEQKKTMCMNNYNTNNNRQNGVYRERSIGLQRSQGEGLQHKELHFPRQAAGLRRVHEDNDEIISCF